MRNTYAVTVDKTESYRLQFWFPFITSSTITNVDKSLLRKLESNSAVELTMADVTCVIRWFNSAPKCFITKNDEKLISRLIRPLAGVLAA